ncbi:MAG: glycosyltransferase [Leptospirales bacterium]
MNKRIKTLFIRPNAINDHQLSAMDHFAIEASKSGKYEIYFRGSRPTKTENLNIKYLGNYPVRKTPVSALNYFLSAISVASQCKNIGPDLVHIKYHRAARFLAQLIRWKVPKAKIVLDIRTLHTTQKIYEKMKQSVIKTSRLFDYIFALNQDILDEYTDSSVPASLLPLGYDPAVFFLPDKPLKRKKLSTLKCIYYGSMNRQRTLEVLIFGLLYALEQGALVEASFFGGGDDKSRLESLVPEKYANCITFHKSIPAEQLTSFMHQSHVGLAYVPVNNLFDPNLPLKTIEMAATGIPILATGTRGNSLIIRQNINGRLVDDNAKAIGKELLNIYKTGFSLRGETVNLKEYQWAALTETYLLPVYKKLVKE